MRTGQSACLRSQWFVMALLACLLTMLTSCGTGEPATESFSERLSDARSIKDPATRAQALLDLAEDRTAGPSDDELRSAVFYAGRASNDITNPRRRCQALIRLALLYQQRSDREGTREALKKINQSFAEIDDAYDQVVAGTTLAPPLFQQLDAQDDAERMLSAAESAVPAIDNIEFRIKAQLALVVTYQHIGNAADRDKRWQAAFDDIEQVDDPRQRADATIEMATARAAMNEVSALSPSIEAAFDLAFSAVQAIDDPTSRAFAGIELIKAIDRSQQSQHSQQSQLRQQVIRATRDAAAEISGRTSRDSILKQLDKLK